MMQQSPPIQNHQTSKILQILSNKLACNYHTPYSF